MIGRSGIALSRHGETRARSRVSNSYLPEKQISPMTSKELMRSLLTRQGRAWTLTSRRFSGLVLPLREKGVEVVVYENFADYTVAQTGEVGVGIDEYLDNPQ